MDAISRSWVGFLFSCTLSSLDAYDITLPCCLRTQPKPVREASKCITNPSVPFGKTNAGGKLIFQQLKSFFVCLRPLKLSHLLSKVRYGRCDGGKSLKKPPIAPNQSQEDSNVDRDQRTRPCFDIFRFHRIYFNPFAIDNVTIQSNWSQQKLALATYGKELGILEDL